MSKPPMVFDPASHTGAGRSKRRPPPRPAKDSLPSHECPVPDCGDVASESDFCHWELINHDVEGVYARRFCSLGCLGRWSALEELGQS